MLPSRVFRGGGRAGAIPRDTCVKDVSEVVAIVADFFDFPEAQAGEVLSAPQVDAAAGLTLGAAAVAAAGLDDPRATTRAGYAVVATAAGGTPGTTYDLEFRGTFSGGNTRVVKGRLAVE